MASLPRSTSHLHITSISFNPQSTSNSNPRVRIRVSNRQGFTSQAQAHRCEAPLRICECHDQYNIQVPYINAWQWQKEIVAEKVAMLGKEKDFNDTLIILQHPPVYTLGTRSTEANLKFDVNDPSFELHRTERGGEVTFHGPGQLVMYPILNLRWHKMDLHWYLRTLEEVVIRALEKACGIRAHRIDGLTGVWVDNQKVAAVGVRVTRWITYHGVALNVTTDLAPFSNIVPCGISDYSVTSVAKVLETSCSSRLGMSPEGLLKLVHECLLAEFEENFNVHLVAPSQSGPEPVPKPSVRVELGGIVFFKMSKIQRLTRKALLILILPNSRSQAPAYLRVSFRKLVQKDDEVLCLPLESAAQIPIYRFWQRSRQGQIHHKCSMFS